MSFCHPKTIVKYSRFRHGSCLHRAKVTNFGLARFELCGRLKRWWHTVTQEISVWVRVHDKSLGNESRDQLISYRIRKNVTKSQFGSTFDESYHISIGPIMSPDN